MYSNRLTQISVPVLFYHHISHEVKRNMAVRPEVFDWQMRYLKDKGFKTIFFNELTSCIKGESFLDSKRVIAISFDDGYLDIWEYAFPILKKYDIKATIFVITSRINDSSGGPKDFLSWFELKQMQSSGLVDIQSHTHTHIRCDVSGKEHIREELNLSKKLIEEKLNKTCNFICWPWGKYNSLAISLAKECGYTGAVTSERGINTISSDIMQIKRFYVRPSIENDKVWFATRLFIYSHLWLGRLYSYIVNKITGILLVLMKVSRK